MLWRDTVKMLLYVIKDMDFAKQRTKFLASA